MKSYIKLFIAVIAALAVLLAGSAVILNMTDSGTSGRPYRVEAERLAKKIENNESYSLDDYSCITNVEKLSDSIETGNSDYLIKKINGSYYRFDYTYQSDSKSSLSVFNFCFGAVCVFVIGSLIYIYFKIRSSFKISKSIFISYKF